MFRFEKSEWPKSSGTRGVSDGDVLPSYVCFLDLSNLCTYSATSEHAGTAWNIAARHGLDYSCGTGGHALAGPKHGMAVGWIRPMAMRNILGGGGVGLTTIGGMVHCC